MPGRRIEYAGSVHDQREIDAVVAVLQGGPTALRIGKHVRAMEQRVAELFGKRRGTFRILYVVTDDTVSVLHVRRATRGPISPGDLS